jgi:non-specific serine/threonine protein kinase
MDRSLVLVEEASEGLRYRMLETVREYARERLQQCGEEEAARAGHLAYFLRLAEEAGPNLRGPNPEAALAQLDAEIDNFRAALAWCQEGADSEGDGAAAALRLVDASWWLWHPQGRLAEGLYWLAGALERGQQLPPAVRAPALFRAAHLWTARGDRDQARSFFQAARREYEAFLAVVRREGNPVAVAEVLLTLSEVAFALDDLDAAGEFCVQARQIFEERQEPAGVARSLEWMAGVASRRQDRQTARAPLEERVAICRKVGVPDLLIHALGALGHLEREEGHYGRAGTLYRESLRLRQEAGALFALAQSLEDLAVLAGREQQFDRGARLLGASEVFCETLGARPPVAIVPEYERTVAECRAALGAATFAAAWAEGRAMSLDQAVEYASERKEPTGGEGEALELEEAPVGTASDRHVAHGRSAAPPSPPPGAAPLLALSRLPRPLTALVGREGELQEVMRLVGSSRLVTLIGGGGVGKTRLALEIAAGLETQYPGRVLFIELTPLADPALLPAFVAAALGLHEVGEAHVDARVPAERVDVSAGGHSELASAEGPGRPEASLLTHTLTNWLAQGPTLLVLDNCEHLIGAAAGLAQSLLQACPELHLLATSRQRLGITGEIAWRVPSLSAPDPERLPGDETGAVEHVQQFPAVQLFLERAAAVRPRFQLRDREDALALARICWRLDGIPLALELAAARVSVLPIPQIAARLDDRFRLLTGGSRAALPRHQTLRALIDWSYDQLPTAEARLLRQLAVFAGGWTLEAAEGVLGAGCCVLGADEDRRARAPTAGRLAPSAQHAAPDVLDLLTSLVEKSLVLVEEPPGGLRYRMLETVRQYAFESLRESGEEHAARARHADYYLALAEQARPFLWKAEPAWLVRVEVEHDNLRAALTHYAAREETIDQAVRLTAALEVFWSLRGHMHERRTWLLGLSTRQTPPTEARAQVLAVAGWMLDSVDGNTTLGQQFFAESLAIMQQVGNRKGIADALNGLAVLESDANRSLAIAEQSVAIMRELGDRKGLADSLYYMGRIAQQRGDFDLAGACWMEVNALNEAMGISGGLVLWRLGDLALASGDQATARHFFERFVTERQAIGDRWALAWGLRGMSALVLAEGQPERAAELLRSSIALKESLASPLKDAERAPYEALRSALREALGESALSGLWAKERVMTPEEAVQYALERTSF